MDVEAQQDASGAREMKIDGKLTNLNGEFVASGQCEVHEDRGEVTMWPSWEMHMLERERGGLVLELADGTHIDISDRHLTFKLAGADDQRMTVYRLRIAERVPEHLRARYVEPGAEAADVDESTDDETAVDYTDAASEATR
jgi:hypothetical protein